MSQHHSRALGTHIVTESPPLGTIARGTHFFAPLAAKLAGEARVWRERFLQAIQLWLNSTDIL